MSIAQTVLDEVAGMDDAADVELAKAAATMERPPYLVPREDGKPDTRLQKALALVRGDKVQLHDWGYAVIGSTRTYSVKPGDGCDCDQATKGRTIWCYHRIATKLYEEWHARRAPLAAAPGMLVPPPQTQEPTAMVPETLEKPTATPLPEPEPERPAVVTLAPKAAPGVAPTLRSIRDIVADLSKPLPREVIASKKVQSSTITYIHWQTAVRLLDTYAPGWYGTVQRLEHLAGHVVIVYRITIPCVEGEVWREATGCEEEALKGYGDVFSNSEAMALKRAAAKFGIALDLYDKDATGEALARHLEGASADLSVSDARKRIVLLLRELGEQDGPKSHYEQVVLRHTGLVLEPQHYGEIIRRLEYAQRVKAA